MRRALLVIVGLAAACFLTASAAQAQVQDMMLNVDGTGYCGNGITSCTNSTVGGYDANSNFVLISPSGFSTSLTASGTGTITLTFNPGAPGSYYADLFILDPANGLNGVAFDQYGATSGTTVAGESWQIDLPDYDGPDGNHTGTIIANTLANTLDNTNNIPGTASNFPGTCSTGTDCDDYTALALGQSFTLASGYEEVVTFTIGTSNPGIFALEDIQPPDGDANPSQTTYYFSEVASAQSVGSGPPPTVPEPSSLVLLGVGLLGLAVVKLQQVGVFAGLGRRAQ